MELHRVHLLLNHHSSLPAATRAGPRPRIPLSPASGAGGSVRSTRGGLALRGLTVSRIRRGLRRPARGGPVGPRSPQTHGYADPASYLELEFAVGFVAEEEMSN
jgi:hypothetical protein